MYLIGMFENDLHIYRVSQKTLFSGILAITPLWKGLELKVGGVLKTSGNFPN